MESDGVMRLPEKERRGRLVISGRSPELGRRETMSAERRGFSTFGGGFRGWLLSAVNWEVGSRDTEGLSAEDDGFFENSSGT